MGYYTTPLPLYFSDYPTGRSRELGFEIERTALDAYLTRTAAIHEKLDLHLRECAHAGRTQYAAICPAAGLAIKSMPLPAKV